jgi:hypothetical protein
VLQHKREICYFTKKKKVKRIREIERKGEREREKGEREGKLIKHTVTTQLYLPFPVILDFV